MTEFGHGGHDVFDEDDRDTRSKAAKRTPLISRVFLIALLLCLAFAAAFLFVRHLTGLF